MSRLRKTSLLLVCFLCASSWLSASHATEWDLLAGKIIDLVAKGVLSDRGNSDNSQAANKGSLPPRCSRAHGQTSDKCYGAFTLPDGSRYVGEYINGKANGQGTITHPNGRKYVGEFLNGNLHGQGIFSFPDGRKYVGEFRNSKFHGQGTLTLADGSLQMGIWKNGDLQKPPESAPVTSADAEPAGKPADASETTRTGSGFFVSKLGHIISNQHVVDACRAVTVGDSAEHQTAADVIDSDRRSDLALLRVSSTETASTEAQNLISKLAINITPSATNGLMRSETIALGEDVLVAGYPYGDIFGNSIKVTKGIVSATRGVGDDAGQFQIDAAVQPGSSGGPIYDEYGNIVGVVVAQLNKMKMADTIGSLPENVNFGIKASTVKQFLNSTGLPTRWSERTQPLSTRDLAQIAKSQTVMVVCHR